MTAVALAEIAEVNPRVATKLADHDPVAFVPMAELNAVSATTSMGETRAFSEVSKGYTLFEDRDLLVAKITPCFENNKIGQARLKHSIGVGSTEFHVVRPNRERVDDRYLLHFLRQGYVRVDGERRMTGSGGQRRVPPAFLRELRVPLPPLEEQRRIAAILDQADALRAKRRQSLAHLDSLGRSIASEALSPALAESSDAVLGDIADVLTGFAFPSARFVAEGVRLCRGANVLPGRLDWSDLRCWSNDEVGGLDRFALSEGDIVLALDRPWITGGQKMARVFKGDLPSLLVQRVARIRASSEELQGLIWAALSSPIFQRYCRPTETTIPHISPVELRNYPIHVPSPPALSRLHATTSALETQRSAATRELCEMEELFASLQSRAFRGEL